MSRGMVRCCLFTIGSGDGKEGSSVFDQFIAHRTGPDDADEKVNGGAVGSGDDHMNLPPQEAFRADQANAGRR